MYATQGGSSRGGANDNAKAHFAVRFAQTLSEFAAERFSLSFREVATRPRSSCLENEGFKILPILSLLILPNQVTNVFAHIAVASGLDSGIDESLEVLRKRDVHRLHGMVMGGFMSFVVNLSVHRE